LAKVFFEKRTIFLSIYTCWHAYALYKSLKLEDIHLKSS